MSITLHHGDCRAVLAAMPAASSTSCVTDPPYHLTARRNGHAGFMGQAWDGGDVAFRPETWQAVWRVLKPGAYCLAFGGTRTFHRLACALEDAGFVLVDTLCWLYASGWPKSHDISKALDKEAGGKRTESVWVDAYHDGRTRRNQGPTSHQFYGKGLVNGNLRDLPATPLAQQWQGYGTALSPAWEPVFIAMKPYERTYAHTAREHGVAGFHIDGARIPTNGEETTTRHNSSSSSYMTRRIGEQQPVQAPYLTGSSHGRWPKNVLLDDAAACQLDAAVGERTSGKPAGTRNAEWFIGLGNGKTPVTGYGDTGPVSRFFYTAKASPSDRGEGNTWPTVKPLALMTYLLRLVTYPEHNLLLDPFCGSGSTLLAADRLGLDAVGIDTSAEALAMARRRLAADAPLFNAAYGAPA